MSRIKKRIISIYNQYLKKCHPAPLIMSNHDTILQIASGKSLGRFGDGEMMLIAKAGNLSFQQLDANLSKRLEEVLRSQSDGFLVGLPRVFTEQDLSERNESSRSFWEHNLSETRYLWYNRINFKQQYASSTFTRSYLTLQNKSESDAYFRLVKSIWDRKKILIIEGTKSRVGVGNGFFDNALSVKRIICPSSNAFNQYDRILEAALAVSKDHLVLIVLGPTATVLAFDLHLAGYHAVDIGHLDIEFEWFLKKCTRREKIPGKWVAESGGMDDDPLSDDSEYQAQIIARIDSV